MNICQRQHSTIRGLKRYGVAVTLAAGLLVPGATSALTGGEPSGLTLPATDPVLTFVAPTTDQPNYAARLDVFLQATVPDVWNGQPVQFLTAYQDAGGVDTLGLPTSEPAADPRNPSFVYQRFQNGVLFYNATEGTTAPLDEGQ